MWPFSSNNQDEQGNPGWQGQDLSRDQFAEARKKWQRRMRPELEEENIGKEKSITIPLTAEPDPSLSDMIRQQHERLGLNPVVRTMLLASVSFAGGLAMGASHGGRVARMRYRAENAHHTPNSAAGWYLYKKSQNYHGILGGVKEGIKVGLRFAGWATMFVVLEEGLDRARAKAFRRRGEEERKGQRDFLNTLSAAVALAGVHGWWNRMDRFAAMRMTRFAIRYAVPYGLAQDLLASLRGDRPWYVDSLMKRTFERNKQEAIATA